MRQSALQQWIQSIGGVRAAAKKLGVTSNCIYHWLSKKGTPTVEMLVKIKKVSKGKLSFEDIIRSCVKQKI